MGRQSENEKTRRVGEGKRNIKSIRKKRKENGEQ